MYTRVLDDIQTEAGLNFKESEFEQVTKVIGTTMMMAPAEAHKKDRGC